MMKAEISESIAKPQATDVNHEELECKLPIRKKIKFIFGETCRKALNRRKLPIKLKKSTDMQSDIKRDDLYKILEEYNTIEQLRNNAVLVLQKESTMAELFKDITNTWSKLTEYLGEMHKKKMLVSQEFGPLFYNTHKIFADINFLFGKNKTAIQMYKFIVRITLLMNNRCILQ